MGDIQSLERFQSIPNGISQFSDTQHEKLMNTRNRIWTMLTLVVVVTVSLAFTATSAKAAVVYQDTFDNDTLAVNNGIGGGATVVFTGNTGNWQDDDDLFFYATDGSGSGAVRASVASDNAFSLSSGFTLEILYDIARVDNAIANRPVFGLLDTVAGANYVFQTNSDHYGIGISLTSEIGIQGLTFSTDSTSPQGDVLTLLSNDQTISDGAHKFVLEMDSASNWSYSIDDAVATTGTIGGAGFDFTRDYQFYAYDQRALSETRIQSVTITESSMTFDPADLNQDGFVDGLDLGIQLIHWGDDVTPDQGELNGAPPVNGLDLGLLLIAWNPKPLSAAAVPEPSSFTLVLASLCLAMGRRPILAR
jgi:hypothetical protein